MKKDIYDLKCSAGILPEKSVILDITADGHYWRTSPLLAISVIRNENSHSKTAQAFFQAREKPGVVWDQNPGKETITEKSYPHPAEPIETVLSAEKESDEYDILLALPELISGAEEIITFNGSAFDLPFLRRKLHAYDLPDAFAGKETRDLMSDYRTLAKILALPSRKLADFSAYIASHTGGRILPPEDIVRQALQSEQNPPESADGSPASLNDMQQREQPGEKLSARSRRPFIPGDDAQRTLEILGFDAFCALLQGSFTLGAASTSGGLFVMELKTPHPAPCRISLHDAPFHIIYDGSKALLSSRIEDGSIQFYHSDVKNYYYLPAEGFAVHKSVGAFVDPSHREKAVRENCFTYLKVTESFLQNPAQQIIYARSALQYIAAAGNRK